MIYESKPCKILKEEKQSGDNYLFRLKCDMNPKPGQFVEVSIPGLGEAPISSASYNQKQLDLNVRVVGDVTYAMARHKTSESFHLRGPYGRGWPMEVMKGNSVVLIGGGCGVAPLRSVIQYMETCRQDYEDVWMFFGFRTPEDVLFEKEIKEWEEKYNMHLTVDEAPEGNHLGCPVGFVTSALEKAGLDNKNKIALVCGPPVMMNKSLEILKKKGFNEDQIFVSFERDMKCCNGKCGHCMIHDKYVCRDGPVFRYDEVKNVQE